jgi:hypothetical protein
MKIIAIGDVHGRDFWKKVAKAESDFDQFIFIGDYFDSFTISPEKQQDNFQEILEFKKAQPEKVTLLIGNHDLHYMPFAKQTCSGYNPANKIRVGTQLGQLVEEGHMKVAHQVEDNVLFSHAGISKTWLGMRLMHNVKKIDVEFINDSFLKYPELFEFSSDDKSGYGEHPTQSPLWIRPESLRVDLAGEGIIQVIGHTGMEQVCNVENKIIMLDAPKSQEYLIIENGEMKPKKLKKWLKKENTG